VYGYYVLYAATLMTETFYIVTTLWTLETGLRIVHLLRDEKAVPLLLGVEMGLGLGLATLLRQSILPWVPVLYLYLLWQGWQHRALWSTCRTLFVGGLLVVALVAPFTVRNYVVYGDFLLLNSNAGYAMYSAQHPMHGTRFREFDAAPLPVDLPQINEVQMDRALMGLGIRFVLEDPVRYLLLSLSRTRAFFEFWPTPGTTLLHNVGRTGSFGLFLPFMVYGLYLAVRDADFVARNALLFTFAAFYTLVHVLTWAMVRYRLPVDATMLPLAALAIVDLGQRTRLVGRLRQSLQRR
jgi:hypothetical protein